jgi:ABC-type transporter Mla subunit MlaD
MAQHEIVAKLAQLHEQLAQTQRADPETLAQLRKLTVDIERLLDENQDVSTPEAEPVTSGLRDLLLRFEADHPQLSVTVGKVADALAAIGF